MTDPFSIQAFSFPEGFIWGSATAGHQIEGDNVNSSYWLWEKEQHAKKPDFELSGKACDSYNRYTEDIALLEKLGHRMYRMSIEWARIEPIEGQFEEKEVEHYINVLSALKEKGIKVYLSLVHSVVPAWFQTKYNWWYNKDSLHFYYRFVEYIVPKLAPYVDMWGTMNEQFNGLSIDGADFKINSLVAHAKAYHIIKRYSDKPVSAAHGFIQHTAYRARDPFDEAMSAFNDAVSNEWLFHAIRTGEVVMPYRDGFYDKDIKDAMDFWSVNTYVRNAVDARKATAKGERYPHEHLQTIKKKFYNSTMNAECMIHNLSRLKDKPVLISENGFSCDDDDFRIIYILEYLSVLSECIKQNVDVKGYLYWSLIDNYEWGSFIPRFGLVSVDREHDFKRTIKPSGLFLKEIIENNGYRPEMLKKYLKEQPKVGYDVIK